MTAENCMTAQNANGDLKALVALKRSYNERMAELQAGIEQLERTKKRTRSEFIEKAVEIADDVFSEAAPEPAQLAVEAKEATVTVVPKVEVKTEVTPKLAPTPPVTTCPDCAATLNTNDKFCSQCAFPLKEREKDEGPSMENWPVGSAGRKLRSRYR
jgi:hypothetical protein